MSMAASATNKVTDSFPAWFKSGDVSLHTAPALVSWIYSHSYDFTPSYFKAMQVLRLFLHSSLLMFISLKLTLKLYMYCG